MIESGIITRTVELGENIQFNLDFTQAEQLAETLNMFFAKQLENLFTTSQTEVLIKLNDAISVAVNKYNTDFTNNEYTGDSQC